MNSFLQDCRYAMRMLLKRRLFTAIVVLTLAVGIGANTAVFSLINAVMFRPLPFDDADRIVEVHRKDLDDFFSHLDYQEYRDRSDVFESMACWSYAPISIGLDEASELRFGQIVSGEYFKVLGVHAIRGRVFGPSDDVSPGAHPVAVVSYRFWQRTFGGSADTVGRTLMLSGHPFSIVGVAPEGFVGVTPGIQPDVWVPTMMQGKVFLDEDLLSDRTDGWLRVIGRLKPDISLKQAQARIDLVAAHLPDVDPDRYENERALLVRPSGIGLPPEARPMALGLTALLMAMVGLVLLIACANVANLLLVRSAERRSEIAVRLALGAGRLRLVRQLLTESVLLALLGGGVGLLLAVWIADVAEALQPELPYGVSLSLDFGVDVRVLAFAAVVSALTGVLFGLAPALQATQGQVVPALKDTIGTSGSGRKHSRLLSGLVIGQVAVSIVLLIGAGLFVRSLLRAESIQPGFDHENVLAVSLGFALHNYDEDTGPAFYDGLLERVRAMPEVDSASLNQCVPLSLVLNSSRYWVEGRPPVRGPDGREEPESVFQSTVSDGDFKTLGIGLLRGRDFNNLDTKDAPGVAIVNQAFAQRTWPGEDPIGKRISMESGDGPFLEIVGVVNTVKYVFIGEDPRPYLYLPFAQNYKSDMHLLVRTRGEPLGLVAPVREAIRSLDATVSPSDTRVLSDWIGVALLPARFAGALFGVFGALALLLATVGLYGVMSFTVGQRTREIGVRMALGARRQNVIALVLRRGAGLTLIGLVVGLVMSFVATRLVSALLYGITATDPVTFVGVSLILASVTLLACYLPARRATKINPVVALRVE